MYFISDDEDEIIPEYKFTKNFDEWFNENYELTENYFFVVNFKELYEKFYKSSFFKSLSKEADDEYNPSNFRKMMLNHPKYSKFHKFHYRKDKITNFCRK